MYLGSRFLAFSILRILNYIDKHCNSVVIMITDNGEFLYRKYAYINGEPELNSLSLTLFIKLNSILEET